MAAMTIRERLMANHIVAESGCWIWTSGTAGAGYGVLRTDKQRYAHRLSYEEFVGPIPDGLEIDHLCRVHACINPHHLEPVTHAENRRRARLTHCKRGHLLEDGRSRPNHGRVCKRCDAIRAATYRAKKRATA